MSHTSHTTSHIVSGLPVRACLPLYHTPYDFVCSVTANSAAQPCLLAPSSGCCTGSSIPGVKCSAGRHRLRTLHLPLQCSSGSMLHLLYGLCTRCPSVQCTDCCSRVPMTTCSPHRKPQHCDKQHRRMCTCQSTTPLPIREPIHPSGSGLVGGKASPITAPLPSLCHPPLLPHRWQPTPGRMQLKHELAGCHLSVGAQARELCLCACVLALWPADGQLDVTPASQLGRSVCNALRC